MTAKELKRLLRSHGCTFHTRKKHDLVYLGTRLTALPRHGTDIGPRLLNKILRDLGIEKEN